MKNKRTMAILDKPVFLTRIAELLAEGYTFPDAITLILPHHHPSYAEVMPEIEDCFRRGLGVPTILEKLGFADTVILSVMIAEHNGQLVHVLQQQSIRLKKIEEAKKKVRNLLTYPIVLFIFITILLVGFRNFFLPNMEALSRSRQDADSVFVSALPSLVAMIPDMIFGIVMMMAFTFFGMFFYYRKLQPASKIKFIEKIAVIRQLYFQWKSQIFARELGSLMLSGVSIQDSLDVLIEQHVDPVLGEIAGNVKQLLIFGEPFHAAVKLTTGLTKEFSAFAKHGEASGHLGKELMIYSDHLEENLHKKITKGLAMLQPTLFSLIAICIIAAYMALLLPIYSMIDKF